MYNAKELMLFYLTLIPSHPLQCKADSLQLKPHTGFIGFTLEGY